MSFSRVTGRVVLLSLILFNAALAATDPIYKALRESAIGDSFVVENVVLKRDAGVLTLKSGAIAFTAPALGRDTVAVFVGEGEFTFTPQSLVDKNYMRSLTQQESVTEVFD